MTMIDGCDSSDADADDADDGELVNWSAPVVVGRTSGVQGVEWPNVLALEGKALRRLNLSFLGTFLAWLHTPTVAHFSEEC